MLSNSKIDTGDLFGDIRIVSYNDVYIGCRMFLIRFI